MKFILVPDSFKGCMSSIAAANAMERGIKKAIPTACTVKLPVADGGEGTVEVFESIGWGSVRSLDVTGPLGERVHARYIISGPTAIIEMAASSGITLVPAEKRDPLSATTFGAGELILDALKNGAKHIVLAVGGSATNDCGTGLASALGARFLDTDGKPIKPGCVDFDRLTTIDASALQETLDGVTITVACDVDNPLCGEKGASAVYGPQKGATSQMVRQMDALHAKFASLIEKQCGKPVSLLPGSGAAGGIGVPLLAFCGANIVSGIETILGQIGFAFHLKGADYVFTGEGKIDAQTAHGKVIAGIAKLASRESVPVIAFGGMIEEWRALCGIGVKSAFSIAPGAIDLASAIAGGEKYLEDCAERVARLLVP